MQLSPSEQLVKTMFRKKNPPPKPVNAEPQNDEAIIDLTEEVVMKAEKEDGATKLTDDAEKDNRTTDDQDKTVADEVDELDTGLAETGKLELAEDDFTVEPIVSDAGDVSKIKEDLNIASSNLESQAPVTDEDLALTEEIDLNFLDETEIDGDDDVVIADNSQDEINEDPAGQTDASTAGNKTHEDDPDLEQKLELEFEPEDEGEDLNAAEDDDHLILEPEEKIESASTNEDVIMALKDTLKDEDDFVGLDDEEPPDADNDSGLLDLDDSADLEDDDLIIPLDDLDTDHDDDIIEITEFDEHFPTDDEALLEQAGMLDAAESEKEDFLELIDLAEDKLLEKDLMGLDDSASLLEKDEVNHLISEGLEEELQKKLTEPSFQSEIEDEDQEIDTIKIGVGDALDQDSRTPEDNEEELTGSPNLVSDAADSDSADEKLESDFDPDEILQPGDRLDAFLSEDSSREPALSSSLLDHIGDKGEDAEQNDLTAGLEMDQLSAITPAQIDAAVERVISQKFSDRIEDIIHKVIEKAVTKEIDRLKRALLANEPNDDSL